ncbi:MAG: hypothetical protein WCR21_03100 [Bacteroidota bacterium]
MESLIIGKREALNNWVRQFITIIDVEKRLFKLQEGLFGIFKWGDFKPLPKIDYVLVFRSLYAKCEDCSIDTDANPNAYYQVSLVYNKNRRIILQETRSKSTAFDLAKKTALALKTKLKDSASNKSQSTWLMT